MQSMEIGREVMAVNPEHIDISGEWLFWVREPDTRLIASLYRLGQVEPALAARNGEGWTLVAGYARTLALRGMNAPLNVLEFTGSDTDMGLAYLSSNMERSLTPGMKLTASRFFSNRMAGAAMREQVWHYLNLDEDSEQWAEIRKWLLLPRTFDGYLFQDILPLEAGRVLAKFKDNELAAFMPVIEAGGLTHAESMAFFTRMHAAGRAGRDDAAKLIDKHGLYDILESDLGGELRRARLMQSLDDMPGDKNA
jgi:hypothetical protein